MKVEARNTFEGTLIFTGEFESLEQAARVAEVLGADLCGTDSLYGIDADAIAAGADPLPVWA